MCKRDYFAQVSIDLTADEATFWEILRISGLWAFPLNIRPPPKLYEDWRIPPRNILAKRKIWTPP